MWSCSIAARAWIFSAHQPGKRSTTTATGWRSSMQTRGLPCSALRAATESEQAGAVILNDYTPGQTIELTAHTKGNWSVCPIRATGATTRQARSGAGAGCTTVGEQISTAISRSYRMRSAVPADPTTTMAPVVMAARMPPTPRGRTCDRPDGRSSTTADRAADDCAVHRAASGRALCERICQRDGCCEHQKTTTIESDASGTPQNVRFLTVARRVPRRTKTRVDICVAAVLHFLRSDRQSRLRGY